MRPTRSVAARPRLWLALLGVALFALAGPVASGQAFYEPSSDLPILVDDSGLPAPSVDQIPPAEEPPPDAEPPPIAAEDTPVDEAISDGISGVAEDAAPEPAPEVGGSEAYATTAAAIGPLQSCRSVMHRGSVGYIAIQTSPIGYVQWGAYMYRWWENYGWWGVNVYVNGRRVDAKSQYYPPHGSLPPTVAPPGSVFSIYAVHVYFQWHWWGWGPAVAYGSVSCIVP
jgi:hypothetical protein